MNTAGNENMWESGRTLGMVAVLAVGAISGAATAIVMQRQRKHQRSLGWYALAGILLGGSLTPSVMGDTWSEVDELHRTTPAAGDRLGISVAIEGDLAVVGS